MLPSILSSEAESPRSVFLVRPVGQCSVMSQSIKALSEKRAEIEAGLKALLADGETRDWTAEDEQKYDAYFAEDSKIKAAI